MLVAAVGVVTRRPWWVRLPRHLRSWRFTLLDAEAMNAAHPDTFWIPSLIERLEIRFGQSVKLGPPSRPRVPALMLGQAMPARRCPSGILLACLDTVVASPGRPT